MNRLNFHSSSTLTAGVMVSANINLHYIGMLQNKFQIFGQIFIEKRIAMKFPIIPNYLPLKEDVALYLNKFDSSATKDALCQVLFGSVEEDEKFTKTTTMTTDSGQI